MKTLLRDLRHGLRLLAKSPGFTAAAVALLALGIGANSAIFSLVNAILVQPLPYPEANRLVRVWHTPPQSSFPGLKTFSVSPANFLDWQAQNHVFEKMGLSHFRSLNLTGDGRPEAVQTAEVNRDFFDAVGVTPLYGRAFTAEEDAPGGPHVVVLGYQFWQARFGGERSIVGREIRLNDQPYKVIGVMGPRVRVPGFAQAWVPLAWDAKQRAVRGNHNCAVIARLKNGVDVGRAQTEMNLISARLAAQYPEDDAGWGALVLPLQEDLVGDVRPLLLVLLGSVAFVLLIACANVANLVLARTLGRRKEIAIRGALGASRSRLVRQLIAETVLLSLLGGAIGLVLAGLGAGTLTKLLADQIPASTVVQLDVPVLLFTLVICVLTGVLAGIAPAWRLTRADVADSLKQGTGRTDADSGGGKARNFLVVAEVALSLVLLVGAGLLIRSLWMVRQIDPGFDPHDVVKMTVILPKNKYPEPAQKLAFYRQLLDKLRALPGAESVGAASNLPLTNNDNWPVAIEGRPVVPVGQQPNVVSTVIAGDYLKVLRMRVLRGRAFTDADRSDSPGVILISESMAKRFWPGEDPLGKRLVTTFFPDKVREVVGVVNDVKLNGLELKEPVPAMYLPMAQFPYEGMDLAIRSKTSGIAAGAIAAVRQVDPDQPVLQAGTLEDLLSDSLSQRRFGMTLFAAFAALALLLAAVGIYSVLSYAVRRRGQEIGLRMALGAQASDVLRLIVSQGMRPTLGGVLVGLGGSLALSRVLAGLVFGVSATDPATIAAVAFVLCLVALAACLLPAMRATRMDPLAALRNE
ncbi:MAG TPA: ABC transporter permease [Thermoanaerobaculia bacterium]|nr:ABC transporter permease [Thermoanaerobaculia bacterium]